MIPSAERLVREIRAEHGDEIARMVARFIDDPGPVGHSQRRPRSVQVPWDQAGRGRRVGRRRGGDGGTT